MTSRFGTTLQQTFVILFCCAVLSFAVDLTHAQEPAYNRFGVVEGMWLPDAVCESGAGWERIIFDWAQIQPNGADDWNSLNVDERWLQAARDCDREVVAIVKHSPSWATDGSASAGLPRDLWLPYDESGNLWAAFMSRLAAYYAPFGVNRFIIWNEPDIPQGSYGFEFEGAVEDYAQLLKVASLAAKAANPNAKIHVAGTTYWYDVNANQRLYVDRLLEIIGSDPDAAAHDYYFDVLTVHVYFRTDTVYEVVQANRAVLERYGLGDKAVWIVETNASPNLDPAWRVERPNWQITLEQQSAFLTQAAALGLAAGAERIAVYKFFDWSLPPGAESFGLIRADETRRPAFDTWQMITQQFADVHSAVLAQSAAVDAVRLQHDDGQETLVAWSRTGESAQIRVMTEASEGEIVLLNGETLPILAVVGSVELLLPGAVCNAIDGCAVGGQPLILTLRQPVTAVLQVSGGNVQSLNFVSG